MSRTRVIYQNEAVYVGPSNPTGANSDIVPSHHVLKHIGNVQGVNYGINVNRQDIAMLGRRSTIASPAINNPSVEFSLTYFSDSFTNEKKLGFDFNYRTGDANYKDDTFSQFLISGFANNEDRTADKRNFYIAISPEGSDLLDNTTGDISRDLVSGSSTSGHYTVGTLSDPESPNFDILTFHDSYLKGYSVRGGIGSFLSCDLDYVCESISFTMSGSGIDVKTFDPVNRSLLNTGINMILPIFARENGPSAIRPGDITLSLTETSGSAPTSGFGFDFNDIKIQSFDVSLDFERDQLNSITHRGPIDRPIKFPVAATVQIESILGDASSGNFADFIEEDKTYDLDILLENTVNCSTTKNRDSAIYVRKALIQGITYNEDIGSNKRVVTSFQVELSPEDLSKGLFLSGVLNTGSMEKLLLESGAL